ncbi:MAG: C2H2-type zinc finger protein [Kistimonas sp.]|nr:C2H2-type zinc finger protein [Kistimonas sp.]
MPDSKSAQREPQDSGQLPPAPDADHKDDPDNTMVTRPVTTDGFCIQNCRPSLLDMPMLHTITPASAPAAMAQAGPPERAGHRPVTRAMTARSTRLAGQTGRPPDSGRHNTHANPPRASRRRKRPTKVPTQARPFVCPHETCGKRFPQKYNLNLHLHTHTGERPYVCSQDGCKKRFNVKSNLATHMRSHSANPSYVCPWKNCGTKIRYKSSLKRHMFIHTGARPWRCPMDDCGKSFALSNYLHSHLQSHAGRKNYSCLWENCGKTFVHARTRTRHMHVHTGQKPCACHYPGCHMSFWFPSRLREHQRTHTGQSPCAGPRPHCDKRFAPRYRLRSHTRSKDKSYRCPLETCAWPSRAGSSLRTPRRRHRDTASSLCPARKSGRTVSRNKMPATRSQVRAGFMPGRRPARPRRISGASYKQRSRNKRPRWLARGRPRPAAAQPLTASITTGQLNGRLPTASSHSSLPAQEIASRGHAKHYRSVIAWVSGGVVYLPSRLPAGAGRPRPAVRKDSSFHRTQAVAHLNQQPVPARNKGERATGVRQSDDCNR